MSFTRHSSLREAYAKWSFLDPFHPDVWGAVWALTIFHRRFEPIHVFIARWDAQVNSRLIAVNFLNPMLFWKKRGRKLGRCALKEGISEWLKISPSSHRENGESIWPREAGQASSPDIMMTSGDACPTIVWMRVDYDAVFCAGATYHIWRMNQAIINKPNQNESEYVAWVVYPPPKYRLCTLFIMVQCLPENFHRISTSFVSWVSFPKPTYKTYPVFLVLLNV